MQQQSQPNKVKYRLLFVTGILCLIAACIFNLMTKAIEKKEATAEEDIHPQFQSEQVAAVPSLGVLTEQVRPLQQTTRVVTTGVHAPEFRGTKYVESVKKNYSIELLQVSKENILKDFLAQRNDRQQFVYLRLSSVNQPERYVLLYGVYRTAREAQAMLARLQLNLPASIKPKVMAFEQYAKEVNDLGTDEFSSGQPVYDVKLSNAPVPRAALPNPVQNSTDVFNQEEPKQPVTTQIVVTQKDQKGQVVHVEQSKSHADNTTTATP